MAKSLDPEIRRALRDEAVALEHDAESTEPYPAGTRITRPNKPSRMFNVRLSDEQFHELQDLARHRHLPMSTMVRAWLLDRLEEERRAG
jgi:stress-induced morphogen